MKYVVQTRGQPLELIAKWSRRSTIRRRSETDGTVEKKKIAAEQISTQTHTQIAENIDMKYDVVAVNVRPPESAHSFAVSSYPT